MDVPVFNKGSYLYSVKLNVTLVEYEHLTKYKWHKLRGRPWNTRLGCIYNYISNEPLYCDTNIVPLYWNSVCVAYSHVDPDEYHDLMRHTWNIDKQGYAYFFNPITNTNIFMHRYIMNFPDKLVVDHILWNRLDNRKQTLRICTLSDNSKNMSHRRINTHFSL